LPWTGMHEEVHASVSWILSALRRSAPNLCVFYTLEGETFTEQTEPDLPGYCGSRPVRLGNQAATQIQLGTYGDLFDIGLPLLGHGRRGRRIRGLHLLACLRPGLHRPGRARREADDAGGRFGK